MYKTAKKHKISKHKKYEIIQSLKKELTESKCIIISNYQGLNNQQFMQLRKNLLKYNSKFKVIKNKFFELSLQNTHLEELKNYINNAIGIVICNEENNIIPILKYLLEYSQENPKLKILGGYLFDIKADSKKLIEISKLPSKEELIAKLVGLLSTPIRRLYSVLNTPMISLVNILKVKSQKTNLSR